MDSALLERLARLRGIGDAYYDYRGELKHFPIDTKAAILRAMGARVDDDAALRRLDGDGGLSMQRNLHASHASAFFTSSKAAASSTSLKWPKPKTTPSSAVVPPQ